MSDSEPTRCPKCGADAVAPLVYGIPDEEGVKMAERGEVVLGGCCFCEASPNWACRACKHEWLVPTDEAQRAWAEEEQLRARMGEFRRSWPDAVE